MTTLPADPCALDAHALHEAIHARRISCRELMQAALARIARLNPRFNAIVNLAAEDDLLRQADERDAELARGQSRGWMHGMPQAIKDTGNAVGFPTTFGSPLLQGALPAQDSVYVARMKAAGCIVIGKTNMPEFGLGSHTYNTLFGATGNAWEPHASAGGSSGGAAVALAQRLLPVADGSDFMGSLRNPAGWNHVFGLRPSQGRELEVRVFRERLHAKAQAASSAAASARSAPAPGRRSRQALAARDVDDGQHQPRAQALALAKSSATTQAELAAGLVGVGDVARDADDALGLAPPAAVGAGGGPSTPPPAPSRGRSRSACSAPACAPAARAWRWQSGSSGSRATGRAPGPAASRRRRGGSGAWCTSPPPFSGHSRSCRAG
jgi:Asp-tRNA(Asn)/Glu-tRNA(Gln) amidotransferase A subunit family amidase